MGRTVALSILLLSSSPSFAADWRLAAVSENEETFMFVDAESWSKSSNLIRFWLESIGSWKDIARVVSYVSADCEERSYSYLESKAFSGDLVVNLDPTSGYATPGSMMRATIDAVCAGAFLTGTIDDTIGYARTRRPDS